MFFFFLTQFSLFLFFPSFSSFFFQVGCTLNCRFCNTGNQPVARNLKAGEIVGQVLNARRMMFDYEATSGRRLVSNIVFMGQVCTLPLLLPFLFLYSLPIFSGRTSF